MARIIPHTLFPQRSDSIFCLRPEEKLDILLLFQKQNIKPQMGFNFEIWKFANQIITIKTEGQVKTIR